MKPPDTREPYKPPARTLVCHDKPPQPLDFAHWISRGARPVAGFAVVAGLIWQRDQSQQAAIRAHFAPQPVSIGRTFKRCLANGLRYRVSVGGKQQDVCVKQGSVIEGWE